MASGIQGESMTYDDWKLRSDRDEYPEDEPEEVMCVKDGITNRHPADDSCAFCYDVDADADDEAAMQQQQEEPPPPDEPDDPPHGDGYEGEGE